jgi:aryl-alcohol dehydrogenase-like predicted oxidoreductase
VEDRVQQRPFGAAGITVSAIGLGAWQLRSYEWANTDEAEALQIVQTALDLGCDFFDTAPSYGGGRSEELLGKALKGRRHDLTICTKFGRTTARQPQFDVAYVRSSLEDSLKRLQTDYVDILVLHSPPRELLDGATAPHYAVLEQLKAEGKLRVYGVSVDTREEIQTLLTTTDCGGEQLTERCHSGDLQFLGARTQEQSAALVGTRLTHPGVELSCISIV